MTAANAIALRGLQRAYDERLAIRDLTLELPAGETLVVLGPNGAGKTTLLRILATLLRPSAGEVTVLGAMLPREAWRVRARIGLLSHEPLLYRELTVAENLAFHARLHGLAEDGERRSRELLDAVGMSSRASERAGSLSAGMLQRVAVCRALLHDPELLLLDEPYAHLDPRASALVEPLIAPVGRRTRVLVTHDPASGLQEADRVLALHADGSVAYEGAPGPRAEESLAAAYSRSLPLPGRPIRASRAPAASAPSALEPGRGP